MKKTEKYITFSILIKNNENKTCKLKFIESYRFMSTSLSDLVHNMSEIDNKDCKHALRGKISNQNVVLSNLKIID